MAELSFNQTLMEECKKRQEEKDHKELIKSLKPLVSSQPAFNHTNSFMETSDYIKQRGLLNPQFLLKRKKL